MSATAELVKGFLFKDPDADNFVSMLNFQSYEDFWKGIVRCRGGEYMACWTYTGIDHESASNLELNTLTARLNELMKSFGAGWSVWTEAIRAETTDYPSEDDCHFPDDISLMIDRERRKAVQEQEAHYDTAAFIVLCYKPPSKVAQRLANAMITDTRSSTTLEEKQRSYFDRTIAQFESLFDPILRITRVGPYQVEGADGIKRTYCDFARLLNYCATGVNRPVLIPDTNIPLSFLIGGQEFLTSFTPKVGEHYVGVIAVEGVADETHPAMLAELSQLPISYRWSTRFIFNDRINALEALESTRKKWAQKQKSVKDQLFQTQNPRIDMDASNMMTDADEARADLQSGDVNNGYYTSLCIVYSSDPSRLDDICNYFKTFLAERGFGGRIEQVNAPLAFLGSIPGNLGPNVSREPMSTMNLAHLMPVASAWSGEQYAPCPFYPPYSPPWLQAETPSSTPFSVNLHVEDVGHTLIIGETGAGKSTLLALLAAQFPKYEGARVIAFDNGRSMYALTRGVGGDHYNIAADEDDAVGAGMMDMMPLRGIDTAAGLSWANEWIERCVTLQGMHVTPQHRRDIKNALDLLCTTPPDERTITEFLLNLNDPDIKEAMSYYGLGGVAGHITDGKHDSFELGRFTVIEINKLMQYGEKVAIPVMDYFFRRIELALDGKPTSLYLDEVWQMFALFSDRIKEWLKTMRRANCAVILATQSIKDAIESGIVETLIDSTATKILLPSPNIAGPNFRPFYSKTLGLNPREIDLLAHATKKKQYYLMSSLGKRLFELNLRPKTLAFCGVSDRNELAKLDDLIAEHPTDWRDRWLEYRNAA